MQITRTRLLSLAALPLLAPAPARADAAEGDSAILRLAASAELVANSFYYRALETHRFAAQERRLLQAARAADQSHYTLLVRAIGADAPVASDFALGFPAAAFASRRATLALGVRIERGLLGIYAAAAGALQDPDLRVLAARLAASEATHLAFLGAPASGPLPEAPALDLATGSAFFDPYLSGADS